MEDKLISHIPRSLNAVLKRPGSTLYHDALPSLLHSYGAVCSQEEDVEARTFWESLVHLYGRSSEEYKEYCFEFWLGFPPTDLTRKRNLIDGAARLLTQQVLEQDMERNEWVRVHGVRAFPGFEDYHEAMMMEW